MGTLSRCYSLVSNSRTTKRIGDKIMTREEICNKYIKVKTIGIPTLHRHPKYDWAFKTVLGTAKKEKHQFIPVWVLNNEN